MIVIKSPSEIKQMAKACRIAAETLNLVCEMARPGIKTLNLNRAAEAYIVERGAKPAFKGYRGYPAALCVSVNDGVIHGIPSSMALKDGDVLSVDVGVLIDGFYGDSARTVIIGQGTAEVKRLVKVTYEALQAGVGQAVAGNRLSDISNAIQQVVESNGFSVVRDFVGHGIGRRLHEDPQIPNYGKPGKGPLLKAGMTFAIEPMVNSGGADVRILPDRWTAVTVDGKPSAHFEHTVAVTENSPNILTKL